MNRWLKIRRFSLGVSGASVMYFMLVCKLKEAKCKIVSWKVIHSSNIALPCFEHSILGWKKNGQLITLRWKIVIHKFSTSSLLTKWTLKKKLEDFKDLQITLKRKKEKQLVKLLWIDFIPYHYFIYLFVCVFKINPWKWYHKATKIKYSLSTIEYFQYCLVILDATSLQ